MALIETNFIRPQEVYDRNTGESKVRYRSYDGNDRFIPVVDGEKGVPKTMVEVTHAELKAMRDGGKLTAGALYRITDYQCTTTQENTRSAGHQFDIVLLALSKDKLAEEGWAMEHPTDVYDVTFSDGVTLKCYMYCTSVEDNSWNIVAVDTLLGLSNIDGTNECSINEETKTVIIADGMYSSEEMTEENITYNYFQNSNLSAWKVWYCLDNDKSRFAWAAPVNGKGVIYRLIDEFNNDVSYDFKNIQFIRPLTDGEYDADNGEDTWCYTFSDWELDDSFIYDISLKYNEEYHALNNRILSIPDNSHECVKLGDNVLLYIAENNIITSTLGCTFDSTSNTECVFCMDCFFSSFSSMFRNCSSDTFSSGESQIWVSNKIVLTES